MRELPFPDEILKPRDTSPIVFVPPQTWHCLYCQPDGADTSRTTVIWVGPNVDGPHGRCMECGQKYCLAADYSMLLREGLAAEVVVGRLGQCTHCTRPRDGRPNVAWRGERGRCTRCGQAFVLDAEQRAA